MDTSERANRARAILNDDLFTEAVTKIRERHLSAFENSAPQDAAAREQAYAMLQALTQLTGELQTAITDEAIKKGRHRGSD